MLIIIMEGKLIQLILFLNFIASGNVYSSILFYEKCIHSLFLLQFVCGAWNNIRANTPITAREPGTNENR